MKLTTTLNGGYMNNYEFIKDLNIIELAHYIKGELTDCCHKRKCEDNCFNCTLNWLKETKIEKFV